MQQLLDPLWGRGARNHMKAGYLGDLGSGAIDALLRGWEAKPSPMSELHVHHMGGAAARVARDSSRLPAPRRAVRRQLHLALDRRRDRRRADRVGP